MKEWITKGGIRIHKLLGGRSNVFLVTRGHTHVLFDTSSTKYKGQLINALQKIGVSDIRLLVLSHTHYDHAGNAAFIHEKFQAGVLVHSCESRDLIRGEGSIPRGTNFITRALVSLLGGKWKVWMRYPGCEPDIEVKDHLDLSSYGIHADLIHTPGHSLGSISMVLDGEIALVGDALFGIFPGSVFPPFADDIEQLIGSWAVLLETGCQWFLPGHGNPISRSLLKKCYRKRRGSE